MKRRKRIGKMIAPTAKAPRLWCLSSFIQHQSLLYLS